MRKSRRNAPAPRAPAHQPAGCIGPSSPVRCVRAQCLSDNQDRRTRRCPANTRRLIRHPASAPACEACACLRRPASRWTLIVFLPWAGHTPRRRSRRYERHSHRLSNSATDEGPGVASASGGPANRQTPYCSLSVLAVAWLSRETAGSSLRAKQEKNHLSSVRRLNQFVVSRSHDLGAGSRPLAPARDTLLSKPISGKIRLTDVERTAATSA